MSLPDNQVEVRYSVDGGHNWSNWRIGNLGAPGQFAQRVIFRRFGSARAFVFQIRESGPIKSDLMAAEVMTREALD